MPKVQPGAQPLETNIVLLLDKPFRFCNMFVCVFMCKCHVFACVCLFVCYVLTVIVAILSN